MTVEIPPVVEPVAPVVDAVAPVAEQTVIILESEFQGGLMTGAIRQMVGLPPKGFEFIEYAVGSAMYIILFAIVVSVFIGFSKMLGAR